MEVMDFIIETSRNNEEKNHNKSSYNIFILNGLIKTIYD